MNPRGKPRLLFRPKGRGMDPKGFNGVGNSYWLRTSWMARFGCGWQLFHSAGNGDCVVTSNLLRMLAIIFQAIWSLDQKILKDLPTMLAAAGEFFRSNLCCFTLADFRCSN